MNIRLVPFNWARHIHVALVTMSSCLLWWWALLAICATNGPFWDADADLIILLSFMGWGAAMGGVFVEGSLEKQSKKWWRNSVLLTGLGAYLCTYLGAGFGAFLTTKTVGGVSHDYGEAPFLLTLKYAILSFVFAGLFFGLWCGFRRKGGLLFYGVVGVGCGLASAIVWHLVGGILNLYYASAFGAVAWGAAYGLLAWGIPRHLYAGWVRVLSGSRFAWRARVDAEAEGKNEIVVGHYPSGLDVWLPAEEGVRELHVSVAVSETQEYSVRGMSLYPTTVKRSLERVDLRYDPSRPAPLETPLSSGDVIEIGDGQTQTTLEFVILPREESR